jgi:hypothetical protein
LMNHKKKDITEKENREPSPISGIYTEKENIDKRPFAVMLDNQRQARPQAGLDQAEIIFECLTEGFITRYMAIYLMNEPELIGPVRSARPYFIEKAMEFDSLYVHVGGSPQAYQGIAYHKIQDIDAMSRDKTIFWRKNHKSKPHNLYTSTLAIRKAAQDSRYNQNGNYETLLFHKKDQGIDGVPITSIQIPYYKDYKPSFMYNNRDHLYYRYINGNPHLDEISKKHLSAKNIIIQKVPSKVIDDMGRLRVNLVGKGEGLYITNGKMCDITWEKASPKLITRFYDQDGKEIRFNPGVTWIEVVPPTLKWVIE